MSYTLIGSLRSPFVRMTRFLLVTNAIDFKFDIINYLEKKEDAEYLAKQGPINKVPILIDESQKIFDSRVIFNHITKKHGLKALTIPEENIQTAIQSCMDVSVNLLLLKMGGMNLDTENWYVKRQRDRVPLAMEMILPWVRKLNPENPADWNYPAMSLYSYADWGIFRELPEVKDNQELKDFVAKFKNAKGVRETDFRV